ncbi:S-layer homology domain-containing protein [Paenibacillus sp. NPDC058071]|uniref:S-layer homology domain-containing protein n=1 Tax=Paenibacillus sp. NPDC058071 TaxID=3346326 RepID=UPI0036D82193
MTTAKKKIAMRKKATILLPVALSASLLISSVVAPFPQAKAFASVSFSDTSKHWAESYITWAVEAKLATGYEDGTFKPNRTITEPEFLALLLRAYGLEQPAIAGKPWHQPYYAYAAQQGWPTGSTADAKFSRGKAARLIVTAVTAQPFSEHAAIQWLLDNKLTNGRTSATVAGYEPNGTLTRAEALAFLNRILAEIPSLPKEPVIGAVNDESALNGIHIGDTADKLQERWGKANRTDASPYSFNWQVYNADYASFAMAGVQNGRVVALFTNAVGEWNASNTAAIGMTLSDAKQKLGKKTTGKETDDSFTYEQDGLTTTWFIDRLDKNRIIGILQSNKGSLSPASGKSAGNKELRTALERQSYDLANAERMRRGIAVLSWDDKAASSARAHSEDMAARSFFSHENPDGASPFDRMKKQSIVYHLAAENIAAGYSDSLYTHFGWVNSEGHRSSLLNPELTKLGAGVAFGGSYGIYYTHNFYTP